VGKRYLSPEEHAEIHRLHAEKVSQQMIARKFGICEATVSNIVHGRSRPRKPPLYRRVTSTPPEPQEQDFSQLPDDVLFKHVREWDFIG
jgi:IS30 family transposase